MKKLLIVFLLLPFWANSQSIDYTHYMGETIVKITVKNIATIFYAPEEGVREIMAKCGYVSPSEGVYVKTVADHKYAIRKKQGFVAMYVNKDDEEFRRIAKELEPYISGLFEDEYGSGFTCTLIKGSNKHIVNITEDTSLNLMKIYFTKIVSEFRR